MAQATKAFPPCGSHIPRYMTRMRRQLASTSLPPCVFASAVLHSHEVDGARFLVDWEERGRDEARDEHAYQVHQHLRRTRTYVGQVYRRGALRKVRVAVKSGYHTHYLILT